MEKRNQTLASEFILLGFSKDLKTNIALFLLIFPIYCITCIGNLCIISLIIISPRLQMPMYFLLCNLSFLDLFFSTNGVPKLLLDLFSSKRIISVSTCYLQIYISLFLGGTECLLLSIMAYDRYVAICHPLYYNVLMSWNICHILTATAWTGSFVTSVVPSLLMNIALCNPNEINHFMCDVLAVVNQICEHVVLSEFMIFSFSLVLLLCPFIFILCSYVFIINSILKISSVGRMKAFSTCSSHLTVVGLFYGTAMLMYSGSSASKYVSNWGKYASVIYVIITPMLNPMIYSLKNREVKEALRKGLEKTGVSHTAISKDI